MDVLIKNLKMPIGERKVVLILKSDGEVSVYEDKHGLVRFTDAIELQEHRRLIDADALIEQTQNWYCSKENCEDDYNGIKCRACWVDDAIGIIYDAPTVLEASNE